LDQLGWSGWNQLAQPRAFADLFNLDNPRPLQQAVIDIAGQIDPPGIVIVEAPMGEGKTEAALYLADVWGVRPGPRGCYIALPTQATSNQMFTRVHSFPGRALPS
jgi:CRISPR-associated endonuclease/helicase Cas3